jgi:hypothetical protein
MHLDGEHTCGEIRAAFEQQFGAEVPVDQIEKLVNTLDASLMLANERYEQAYAAQRDAYLAAKYREGRDGWLAADDLRPMIEQMLASGSAADADGLRGFIAPHLDYGRGGPCYADAYAALAQAPPVERYVILGTNHFGRCSGVVAASKDFTTPFGRVPTDRACLGAIESQLGRSLCEYEFDHAREHSIELQIQLLQVARGERPFEVLSFLIPDPSGATGTKPVFDDGPDLHDFVDALRAAVDADGKSTIWIASADWSHVGEHFGDTHPTTSEFLEQVGENDRRLLTLLEDRRERDFVADVGARGNPTRICSVGCMYALLVALPEATCRQLRYHQAVDMQAETHVTCAAAILQS